MPARLLACRRECRTGAQLFFGITSGIRAEPEKQPKKASVDRPTPPRRGERAGAGGALAEVAEGCAERGPDKYGEENWPVSLKDSGFHRRGWVRWNELAARRNIRAQRDADSASAERQWCNYSMYDYITA